MPGEVELADDLGPQQADDVRGHREAVARHDLLGDGSAAQHVSSLQHEHAPAGPGEVGGADQAVVAAADHDGVVRGSHRRKGSRWCGVLRYVHHSHTEIHTMVLVRTNVTLPEESAPTGGRAGRPAGSQPVRRGRRREASPARPPEDGSSTRRPASSLATPDWLDGDEALALAKELRASWDRDLDGTGMKYLLDTTLLIDHVLGGAAARAVVASPLPNATIC